MITILKELFISVTGVQPQAVVKLTGDGSNRAYYRLVSDGVSLIGVAGVSVEENRAFVAVAKAFCECGIDAPRVLAVSDDSLCYLQEDLGDVTLFDRMKKSRDEGCFSQPDINALCRVMQLLPDIQYKVARKLDFAVCYPVADFDRRAVMWDLNYFKYCFLKGVGAEFDEKKVEDEFETLAAILLAENGDTFMYRDFQSRNVMWHDERPWFIDFQGGRKGPIYYDVASFVGQARAKYTCEVADIMLDAYIESLSRYREVEKGEFVNTLRYFRIFRLMQNLGAYGFRGLFERKKRFVESIPAAMAQLNELLCKVEDVLPTLCGLMKEIAAMPRFVPDEHEGLVVDVYSFSYRRGIPEDYSGNGGGFVFDCRAIHNPGRYEPYKKLTGMDEPVKKFLEEQSCIADFLENVYALADNMVEDYLRRGFSHIQLCFGCTGGQHRSVYSAEHTAEHIAKKFGVRVNVNHIMQGVKYTLNK